jgi:hypothetical protein
VPPVGAIPPFARAPGSAPDRGDLFSPVTPGTPPEEAVGGAPTGGTPTGGTPTGGTPTGTSPEAASEPEPASDPGEEERPGLVNRAKAQVAGWFEPVTSSQDAGFGGAGSWRDEPPSNGHHQDG